jgi:hypothetical protein
VDGNLDVALQASGLWNLTLHDAHVGAYLAEEKVLNILANGPSFPSRISKLGKLPIQEVRAAVINLVADGKITCLPNQHTRQDYYRYQLCEEKKQPKQNLPKQFVWDGLD